MLYGKGIYKKTLILGGKNKAGEMFYTTYNSKDRYILKGNYKTIEDTKKAILAGGKEKGNVICI